MSIKTNQMRDSFNDLINVCFSGGIKIINRFTEVPVSKYSINISSNVRTLGNIIDLKYKNCVYMNFEGGISGIIVLLFPSEKEKEIALSMLMGFPGVNSEFITNDKKEHEIYKEVANIIFCNILGTFSNLTLHYTNYLPPIFSNTESVEQFLRNFINFTKVDFEYEIEGLNTNMKIMIVLKHARPFERYIEPYVENYINR